MKMSSFIQFRLKQITCVVGFYFILTITLREICFIVMLKLIICSPHNLSKLVKSRKRQSLKYGLCTFYIDKVPKKVCQKSLLQISPSVLVLLSRCTNSAVNERKGCKRCNVTSLYAMQPCTVSTHITQGLPFYWISVILWYMIVHFIMHKPLALSHFTASLHDQYTLYSDISHYNILRSSWWNNQTFPSDSGIITTNHW